MSDKKESLYRKEKREKLEKQVKRSNKKAAKDQEANWDDINGIAAEHTRVISKVIEGCKYSHQIVKLGLDHKLIDAKVLSINLTKYIQRTTDISKELNTVLLPAKSYTGKVKEKDYPAYLDIMTSLHDSLNILLDDLAGGYANIQLDTNDVLRQLREIEGLDETLDSTDTNVSTDVGVEEELR